MIDGVAGDGEDWPSASARRQAKVRREQGRIIVVYGCKEFESRFFLEDSWILQAEFYDTSSMGSMSSRQGIDTEVQPTPCKTPALVVYSVVIIHTTGVGRVL